jgi:hypothetical protein
MVATSILAGLKAENIFPQLLQAIGNISRMIDFVGINTSLLSALIISKVQTIHVQQIAASIVNELQRKADYSTSVISVLQSALKMSNAFSNLYKDISLPDASFPEWAISRDILTPPTTTGIALETTRTVSIGEQRQSVDVEAATQGIQLVRTYLASIKEDFVVMWDDCWYALQSGNPDSLSGPSGKFTRQWV